MKHLIQFIVNKEDEGGYSASAVGFGIVTQGESFEELVKNIREAVALYFDDENTEELGVSKNASVLLNFEVPPIYA